MTDWTKPARPYSIAHRGASAYAPDCSLEAYEKAALLGADIWEVDIRLSSDGQLFAFHDDNFPDGQRVCDLTAEQVAAEAKTQGVPAERFETVLKLATEKGAGIYADIKDVDATLQVLEGLKAHNIEKAILGAFDPKAAQMLAKVDCPYPRSALVPIGADPFEHAAGADVIHLCWEHMERPQDLLDIAFFAEAQKRNQLVALWHEEDPKRIAELRHLPVMGICSDRPELVNPWQPPSEWPVEILCHRGACEIAPENTIEAIHCAYAAGFPWVEIDVYSTVDGALVVHHDITLNRTTTGTGAITWQNSSDLSDLSAGSWQSQHFAGQKVPHLQEVLDLTQLYNGRLYIEMKAADPGSVYETVAVKNAMDRCFFWSFDFRNIQRLRALAPTVNVMVRRQDRPKLRDALALEPFVVEFTPEDDPTEFDACRAAGAKVMIAYMGRDYAKFDRIAAARPDMVNLHFPLAFRDWLNKTFSKSR